MNKRQLMAVPGYVTYLCAKFVRNKLTLGTNLPGNKDFIGMPRRGILQEEATWVVFCTELSIAKSERVESSQVVLFDGIIAAWHAIATINYVYNIFLVILNNKFTISQACKSTVLENSLGTTDNQGK